MTEKPKHSVSTATRIATTLRELISALDRRVPQVDRPGEHRIARDAHALRGAAVAQIEALSRQQRGDKLYDEELVEAIMTDDGCPSPERETNMRSSGTLWSRSPCLA
jgi:hypothetical protein